MGYLSRSQIIGDGNAKTPRRQDAKTPSTTPRFRIVIQEKGPEYDMMYSGPSLYTPNLILLGVVLGVLAFRLVY
jgi:hypothetical protein